MLVVPFCASGAGTMDDRIVPRAARARRPWRTVRVMAALGPILALALTTAGSYEVTAKEDGPRLLYLPMRWCVLEGSQASKRNPDGAVLERIRRASSILAPRAGITLRSAINNSLGDSLGFPVIKDPRKRPGRPGDVRTPVESSGEYELVVSACEQAWQRMERLAGKQVSFGGLAKGPIAVIIRDFVNGNGTPVGNVWGYARAARVDRDYCNARLAPVRHATGGSLLVVDSRDGHPSRILDRRLVAHEIGHILLLGHGNGLDDLGSQPNRIDKWCDATENPDIVPGSLMTYTLSYENMEPWQQRLPRHVVSKHPAGVGAVPFLQPRVRQKRVKQLQRIANGGSRIVRRLVPPTRPPLTPLPRLWSAGVRGDDFADRPRDMKTPGGKRLPSTMDLDRLTVTRDVDNGDVSLAVSPRTMTRAAIATGGAERKEEKVARKEEQLVAVFLDADGDPKTGGPLSTIPGNPVPELDGVTGIELLSIVRAVDGEVIAQAWRWDDETDSWQEIVPPPLAEVTVRIDEEEHGPSKQKPEPGASGQAPMPDTFVVSIPSGVVELGESYRTGALLRTTKPNGRTYVDMVPTDPAAELVAMSAGDVEYPVCAVNRDTEVPGTAQLGDLVTLEVDGFKKGGPLTVWLGDQEKPVARLDYQDMPCDWPWVGEFKLPKELAPYTDETAESEEDEPRDGAATSESDGSTPEPSPPAAVGTEASGDGLYMLQVVLDGTGLTADCPVVIGEPEMPEWFAEDDEEAAGEIDEASGADAVSLADSGEDDEG